MEGRADEFQIEDIDNASCATITVSERMDGFKLVVANGHADERIEITTSREESLQITKLLYQYGATGRRGIGDSVRVPIADDN